jgi:hypothetical protein
MIYHINNLVVKLSILLRKRSNCLSTIIFYNLLIQHRLRWFGHVQRRPPEASVRSGVLKRADNVKSGRGRPKLTWDESVKRDLKEWNISKDLALDRSAWRLAINVPEP